MTWHTKTTRSGLPPLALAMALAAWLATCLAACGGAPPAQAPTFAEAAPAAPPSPGEATEQETARGEQEEREATARLRAEAALALGLTAEQVVAVAPLVGRTLALVREPVTDGIHRHLGSEAEREALYDHVERDCGSFDHRCAAALVGEDAAACALMEPHCFAWVLREVPTEGSVEEPSSGRRIALVHAATTGTMGEGGPITRNPPSLVIRDLDGDGRAEAFLVVAWLDPDNAHSMSERSAAFAIDLGRWSVQASFFLRQAYQESYADEGAYQDRDNLTLQSHAFADLDGDGHADLRLTLDRGEGSCSALSAGPPEAYDDPDGFESCETSHLVRRCLYLPAEDAYRCRPEGQPEQARAPQAPLIPAPRLHGLAPE